MLWQGWEVFFLYMHEESFSPKISGPENKTAWKINALKANISGGSEQRKPTNLQGGERIFLAQKASQNTLVSTACITVRLIKLHYLFVCNILSANKSIHHHGVKFLSTRDLTKQITFLELSYTPTSCSAVKLIHRIPLVSDVQTSATPSITR